MRNADYSMMVPALFFNPNGVIKVEKKIGKCDLCNGALT